MDTENNIPQRRNRRSADRSKHSSQEQIQYIPPKPFFRKRLIVQLLTVVAVVLAIAIGVSVFFQVDTVTVTGLSKYSAATVVEASHIRPGDSLLFFGQGGAASRIKTELPYVESVRFEVKLPGTVNIVITERPVAYTIQAADGNWWRLGSDGKVVESVPAVSETDILITGVLLDDPVVGKKAVASESVEEDQPLTASQSERLAAAVDIARQLEKWEMFSQVEKIDVSDLFGLRLYCTGDYRVELGDGASMEKKIGIVKSALSEPSNAGGGVLELFYKDKKWQVLWYRLP